MDWLHDRPADRASEDPSNELKRARDELASRARRLELATQIAGLGLFVWDRQANQIISETPRNYEMFGRTPADAPLSLEDFINGFLHPEDKPEFTRQVQHALQHGTSLRIVCRIRRQNDGAWRWLEIAGVFESPDRLIGVLSDITERRQREQDLRDRNTTLLLAMRGGRMGAWVQHFADKSVEWSRELEEIFGLPAGGFAKTEAAFFEYVHPEDRPHVAARVARAVKEETDYGIEFRFRHASGEWRWMEARGKAVYDAARQPVRMFGIGIDITDRRRTEEALREADRRKDEFLAVLAHELRNPLAPIRNAVQFMRTKDASESALQNARDIVERQVRHMVRLVDDLLEVSRITSGRIELDTERVSLDIVVTNAVEAAQPLIQSNGHELSIRLPSEPVFLDADLTRMSQVLANLLNNAAKYTPPRGRIALTAEVSGAQVEISVRDNGIGIPGEQLAHIFELFVQLGRQHSQVRGGLGIGLTLARQLVRLHGGTLEARSEGQGRGSEFVVRLPMAAAPAQYELSASAAQDDTYQGQRILVVDDNVDAADSLTMNLQHAGHEVRAVYSGAAALDAFREESPDVVVLDLGLPDISGVEIARELRAEGRGRDVVLIALTGWGREEDRERTTAAGFDEHLTKPVDTSVLLQIMAMHRRDAEHRA
jgi:PAS domain S-box-containing protein